MANYNLTQTGAQVQALLDAVESGYVFLGTATPTTTPDTTNPNVCYLATTPGTYTSFGSAVLSAGNIGVLCWNGSTWALQTTPTSIVTDSSLTSGSTNPVQGGVVYDAIQDYYVNEEVTINNNAQRTKVYTIAPGSKIVVRVSLVTGTSKTYNLSWTKAGGNVTIFSGYPLGYMSDVLTVPNDATGVTLFITPSASGNTAKVEIFKADRVPYINAALTKNVNAYNYINNRQIISKTASVVVSSSLQEILTINDCKLLGISGNFYAFIDTSAVFDDGGKIRFYWSDTTFSDVYWLGRNPKQLCGFALDGNKTLERVGVFNNSIITDGDVSLTIFATDDSELFLDYPLKNKKIMLFGDSNTEFKYSVDNKTYSDWLSIMSLADTYNVGIGGTCLSARATLSLTPTGNQQAVAAFDMVSLIEAWATNDYQYQDAALASGQLTDVQQSLYTSKLATLKANPISTIDIVTIWGGGNDYNSSHTIGDTSISNTDKLTICGSINKMAQLLYTANPMLRIVTFCPLPHMYGGVISNSNISDVYIPDDAPSGKSLPEVGEIIEGVWKQNHIPVDNWYWEFGVNAYNWDNYYTDGAHIQKAYEIVARKVYQFILANPIGK